MLSDKVGGPTSVHQIVSPKFAKLSTATTTLGNPENDPMGHPITGTRNCTQGGRPCQIERAARMANEYGIELNRLYFREDICEMWGYEFDGDEHNRTRWFSAILSTRA